MKKTITLLAALLLALLTALHARGSAAELTELPPVTLTFLPYVCTPRCGGTTVWDRFAIKIIGRLKQLVPPSGDDLKPHDFSDKYR